MVKYPSGGPAVFSSSTTPLAPIGARAEDLFGRVYIYVQAGAAALVAGNAIQSAAEVTAHQALTAAAAAIGDKVLTMTLGAAAAAANLYAGGVAVIDTTPGEGYSYPISGHLANAGSATLVVNLQPGWPVQVALTTSSKINLYTHPCKNVIQYPVTTASGACVGCAQYPIGISEYGWIGRQGRFGSLIAGTPAIGAQVTPVGAVAGALSIWSGTLQSVGTMTELGVNTKIQAVDWRL